LNNQGELSPWDGAVLLIKETSNVTTIPELPTRPNIDFGTLLFPVGLSPRASSSRSTSFEAVPIKKPETTVYLPTYDGLDPRVQNLLSPETYQGLSTPKKLAFLTITTQLLNMGAPLEGLRLKKVCNDRLLFEKEGCESLKGWLRGQIATNAFQRSIPFPLLHPSMSEWGGRENTRTLSLQVGGGKNGVFVDIDLKNPHYNPIGHLGEMLANWFTGRKTNPIQVALALSQREGGMPYRFEGGLLAAN
jgi:hypothetical protein